jgi:hypothetical protein
MPDKKPANAKMLASIIKGQGIDYLEGIIVLTIREAIQDEREACIRDVLGCMHNEGTDDPHQALEMAVQAIRARSLVK